jgi:hypothetical protein
MGVTFSPAHPAAATQYVTRRTAMPLSTARVPFRQGRRASDQVSASNAQRCWSRGSKTSPPSGAAVTAKIKKAIATASPREVSQSRSLEKSFNQKRMSVPALTIKSHRASSDAGAGR